MEQGRCQEVCQSSFIAVRDVVYDKNTNKFTVVVKDLVKDLVLAGKSLTMLRWPQDISTPNIPEFEGLAFPWPHYSLS